MISNKLNKNPHVVIKINEDIKAPPLFWFNAFLRLTIMATAEGTAPEDKVINNAKTGKTS